VICLRGGDLAVAALYKTATAWSIGWTTETDVTNFRVVTNRLVNGNVRMSGQGLER